MNSQLFFILNLVFGLLILFLFLSARRSGGSKPTQLKMKNSSPSPVFDLQKQEMKPQTMQSNLTTEKNNLSPQDNVKNLNIFFMYNGHDWDAYQVLGLPAGASLKLTTQRYQELVVQGDQGQKEFYEAAYQAILKNYQAQR